MKNSKQFIRKLMPVTVAMCTLATMPSVFGFELEEVVVTAQKRAEDLQDVPITVSAFSGEDLTAYGVGGVQSLQAVTPGLVYNKTGAQAQPYLRGIGTRFALMGLESSIATYVDDRYIPRASAAMLDLADVERIEVLKGPQGTLYGRNATGGAIRIISKDPADELEGSIAITRGNYNYWGLTGTASIPLADNVAARVTALVKNRDGYADNITPQGASELDDQDIEAYRAKILWDISDQTSLRFTIDYWEQNDNFGNDIVDLSPAGLNLGTALGGLSTNDTDKVATSMDDLINTEDLSASIRLDTSFDDFDFVSISTYETLDSHSSTDGDGTSAVVFDNFNEEDAETYSQEFQVLSNSDSDLQWLAGAYIYYQDGSFSLNLDVSDAGIPLPLTQGKQDVKTSVWSLFGQATAPLSENWSLTLGARWNSEEKEVLQTAMDGFITIGGALMPFEDSDKWDEFTPKVSLEYALDSGITYLTYARGFKSGGFSYPAVGTEPLDPEILDMLELGVKLELLDNQLRINSSLYYYDYQDLQVTRAGGGSGTAITLTTDNAANATVMGLDANIVWLATETLQISTGFNIADSEFEEYDASAKVYSAVLDGSVGGATPTPGMADVAYDASGESLLRAPDFEYYLSASYEFFLGDARIPLNLTYSYKDDFNFDFVADPTSERLTQEGYALLNARVAYEPASELWSLALWGNNLTGEDYFDDLAANTRGMRGSPGAPRTYGLDFTLNF